MAGPLLECREILSLSRSRVLDYILSPSRIGGVSKPLSIRVELSNQAAAGAGGGAGCFTLAVFGSFHCLVLVQVLFLQVLSLQLTVV